jgi:hypothetical protein
MANLVTTQLLVDGPNNVVIRVDGFLDTSDLAATVIIDPALLSVMDSYGNVLATKLRVDKVTPSIEAPLTLYLSWDATAPVRFLSLNNASEEFEACDFGGILNNAGAGVTGKITLTTQGWVATAINSFSLIVEMKKQK